MSKKPKQWNCRAGINGWHKENCPHLKQQSEWEERVEKEFWEDMEKTKQQGEWEKEFNKVFTPYGILELHDPITLIPLNPIPCQTPLTSQQKELKSNCCKAKMVVATADEGTNCYICSECKNPCDSYSDINQKDWEKEFIQEFGIHFSESELQFTLLFITELLQKERTKAFREVIKLIDADYKDRDITIYELAQAIINKAIHPTKSAQ